MIVSADLHIHSCLSPCGDLSMSPGLIARTARERGLKMAALTDHNSALNIPAFAAACAVEGITGVYGLEVNTREEAHVLCLFETPEAALALGSFLYPLLPDIPNNPLKMGDQVYVDQKENILGEVEKWLLGGADIGLEELLEEVHSRGGLFIPAHIDRPAYSIPSQLGFLPSLAYDALESVTVPTSVPLYPGAPRVIQNSDAHYPEDVAKRTTNFEMETCGWTGLVEALRISRQP